MKEKKRIKSCLKINGGDESTRRFPLRNVGAALMVATATLLAPRLAAQVAYNESFDGTTFVPSGWTNLLTSGSNSWTRVTAGTLPTQSPHSGAGEAKFDSWDYNGGVRSLITPPFSLVNNTSGAAVSFWMYRDNGYNTTPDKIEVYYNTSASLTGATLLGTVNRAIGLTPTVTANGWYQYSYSIPNTVTSANVYLILKATSAYGNNMYIDDVSWTAYPQACSGSPATPTIAISTPSGCPGVGFNISSTGTSNDAGITFQWESATSASGPWSAISGATLASYASSTTSSTYYRMVTGCSNSGLSATTSAVSYSVVNPGPCICNSYGPSGATSTFDEEVFGVYFGSMVNTSTCGVTAPGPGSIANRYSNYAGYITAPDVCQGAAVPFTVNIGTCNGWYGMQFRIYIDYNQNGLFTDAGEMVYANTSAIQGNNAGTVTIPINALTGITRMRVIAVEGSISGPTSSYSWGETEDYCISVLPAPGISLTSNAGSVCPGAAFSTTASGAVSYTINGGAGSVSGSALSLSPIVNTTYTITGTGGNGCRATLGSGPQATVTTLASPDITIAATSTAICTGSTATLTASGANTYTWGASAVSSTLAVNPAVTSVYTVTGTGTNVCNGVKNYTLVVNPLPTVSVNSGSICSGDSFTLNPSGASTYTFSGGSSVVSPTATSSFSVTGTSTEGCVSAAPAVADVTVHALPVVSISNGSVCEGQSYLVSPSGAVSYNLFGTTNPVTPSVTATYSITGTSSLGCVSPMVTYTIVVVPKPALGVNSPTETCLGTAVALTATGAVTYTWSTGATTSSISQNPTVTTSYYVIGADSSGCVNVATHQLLVKPVPPLSISATATLLCTGGSATLTVSGADTYTWSTGSNNVTLPVSPTVTSVYSATGSNSVGCAKTLSMTIAVNTLVATISPNSAICLGSAITLTAGGGGTYLWYNNSPFSAIVLTPTATASYSVKVTDPNNCPHVRTVTVTVNANPVVTASASTNTVCTNETVIFTAGGASTYTWSAGLGTGSQVTLTPVGIGNFMYVATGTDNNGCQGSANVSLHVSSCTGIRDITAGIAAEVYPNPTNGSLYIVTPAAGIRFTLSDLTGRTLMSGALEGGANTIDLATYTAGVYILRLDGNHASQTIRIVRQ